MKSSDSSGQPSTSPAAQTATVRSLPSSVVRHQNPDVRPVGGAANTGGRTK